MPNTIPASRRAQPQKDKPKVHALHEDLQPSSENELWVLPLGSFSNDDGDGSENVKKQ